MQEHMSREISAQFPVDKKLDLKMPEMKEDEGEAGGTVLCVYP